MGSKKARTIVSGLLDCILQPQHLEMAEEGRFRYPEVIRKYPIFLLFLDERKYERANGQWVLKMNGDYINSTGISIQEFKFFLANLNVSAIGFKVIGADGRTTRADLTITKPHKYYMLVQTDTYSGEMENESIIQRMAKRYAQLLTSSRAIKLTKTQIEEIVGIIQIDAALRVSAKIATEAVRDTYREQLKEIKLVPLGFNEFKHRFTQAFIQSIVIPGTSIGANAAEGVGEPATQMTLKTFHFAGTATNVAFGLAQATETFSCLDTLQQEVFTVYYMKPFKSFDDVYDDRKDVAHVTFKMLLAEEPQIILPTDISYETWYDLYEITNQRKIPVVPLMTRLLFKPSQLYAYKLSTHKLANILENYKNTPIYAIPSPNDDGIIDIFPLRDRLKDSLVAYFSSEGKTTRATKKKTNTTPFDGNIDHVMTEDEKFRLFLQECVIGKLNNIYIQGIEYIKELNPVTFPILNVLKNEELLSPVVDDVLSQYYNDYTAIKKNNKDDLLNVLNEIKDVIYNDINIMGILSKFEAVTYILSKEESHPMISHLLKFFNIESKNLLKDALDNYFSVIVYTPSTWVGMSEAQKITALEHAKKEDKLGSRWIFQYNLMIMKRDGTFFYKIKHLLALAKIRIISQYTEGITSTMRLIMEDMYKNITDISTMTEDEIFSNGLIVETLYGRSPYAIISELNKLNMDSKKQQILDNRSLRYIPPSDFDRFGNFNHATTINKRKNDEPNPGKRARFVDLLKLDGIDYTRCYCNNVNQIYEFFGITAVSSYLFKTLYTIIKNQGINIDFRHLFIIVDFMTFLGEPVSITYVGISKQPIGPISSAAFSHTLQFVTKYAASGREDDLKNNVAAATVVGRLPPFGTGQVKAELDPEMLKRYKALSNIRKLNAADTANSFNKLKDTQSIDLTDISIPPSLLTQTTQSPSDLIDVALSFGIREEVEGEAGASGTQKEKGKEKILPVQ